MEMPICLTNISGTEAPGTIDVEILNATKVSLIAAKRGGIFLILAILSVPIPALHFVLVPLFLLISIGVFLFSFTESKRITSGKGMCPSCQQEFVLSQKRYLKNWKEVCPVCRQMTRIRLQN